jgi:hypothetical protein
LIEDTIKRLFDFRGVNILEVLQPEGLQR